MANVAPNGCSASSLRIVIVSPVRLMREGLAQMLAQRPRVKAVIGAERPQELDALRGSFAPNLLLVDVTTEEGMNAVKMLTVTYANTLILGFGANDRDDDVLLYAEAGLAGYIPRDASTDELFDAVDRVANGELICSPRAAGLMYRRLSTLAGRDRSDDDGRALTAREREIVRCIDAGLSNKAIARELHIGLSTVKNHVHRILEKLAVTRRGEAAARIRALLAQPARGKDLGSHDPPR